MNPGGHPTASPTHTIANRILVFFLLAIAGFVVALTYSVFALRLAARDTERLAQGFLPGSHALAQLRASHGTIATLTDGIPDERNPIATRYLLERLLTARKLRFSDTRVAIEQGARLFDDDAAVRTLERYLVDLATIETTLREDAELFERLFTSLERGERDSINRTLVELGKIEHDSDRSLQALADRLQGSMDALTQSTRQREMRTRVALIALAIGAFAVAALATLFSRRLLKPLAAITERARSVAAGDLSPRDTLLTGDELGELSSAFEKMVTALSAEQAKSLSNERLAAIGKMAAHVTHEVRNPLSSIGLNLEMLEEELATAVRTGADLASGNEASAVASSVSSQESMSLVRSIRREVERLEKLSEEYLRVAKLPSPRMEAENFLDVVRAAVDFVRSD
ncbi:MAG: HAMP domain-containing protein, partial [Polyangiaceae bacterium]|nr:HAMP domain-containing protein [Polyangiaceae bacterium]